MNLELTVKDVAQRRQVSEETVRRWLRSNLLKGVRRTGKSWTVFESDLEAFVAPPEDGAPAPLFAAGDHHLIYAFVNLKGGVGKTTSAIHTAAVAAKRGLPVVVIDADSQSSAFHWARMALEGGQPLPFEVVPVRKHELPAQARELRQTHNVVIDTANSEDVLMHASGISDATIVPMTPTMMDADRLGPTLQQLASLELIKPGLNVSILVTRYSRGERLSRSVFKELARFPLLESTIRDLVPYKASFGTVPSYLEEYERVWDELHGVPVSDSKATA